jgi:Mn2+/Fe2+ NRAMP family transporter
MGVHVNRRVTSAAAIAVSALIAALNVYLLVRQFS